MAGINNTVQKPLISFNAQGGLGSKATFPGASSMSMSGVPNQPQPTGGSSTLTAQGGTMPGSMMGSSPTRGLVLPPGQKSSLITNQSGAVTNGGIPVQGTLPGGQVKMNAPIGSMPIPTQGDGGTTGNAGNSNVGAYTGYDTSGSGITNAVDTPPKTAINDPGAYTYSGGMNANGEMLSGYTGSTGGTQSSQGSQGINYSGLVSRVAEQSSKPSDSYNEAQKQALSYQEQLNQLRQQTARGIGAIELNGGTPMSQAMGQEGAINRLSASRENALASAFQGAASLLPSATAQQSAQIQGTTGAANLAAPQLGGFNQQYFNPLGGQSGGGGSLQDAVSNVVQRLTEGTMSYDDATNALSGYGQGGTDALQRALPAGFNIAQSRTLAGQQGSIGVNYQLADTALKNVEDIMQKLGGAQTTNIPGINKIANWISTQFGVGSEQTRAMTGAVQSLRNAYASLLASSKGGTPTDYSGQAQAEIPDEPTPNDMVAIRHNFETLGKARAGILGNPGQSGSNNSNGTQSSSDIFNF